MARADTAARIVDAAIAHGVAQGVAALSLQGIAAAAGVSKALVLYHFGEKDRLLAAVAERLVTRDVAAVEAATTAADALEAWRAVAGDARGRAERALLLGLLHEAALRAQAEAIGARRVAAATRLATAMLRSAELRPRIAPPLVGRVLLHQLDGVAAAGAWRDAGSVDAELDAFALALLGLGQ